MTEAIETSRPQRARRTPMTAPVMPEPPELATTVPAAASDAPLRPARRPFGTRQERLENPPIPGFQAYWFNDTPGRIERALAAGYTHVLDKDDKPVKHPVGVAATGGALFAYRMKIPIEFFIQDKEAKEAPRRQTDEDMRSGRTMKDGIVSQGRPGYIADRMAQAEMAPDGRQTTRHWKASE